MRGFEMLQKSSNFVDNFHDLYWGNSGPGSLGQPAFIASHFSAQAGP